MKKRETVQFPMRFNESVGVTWNADHTRIVNIEWARVLPAIRKASRTLARRVVKQSRKRR